MTGYELKQLIKQHFYSVTSMAKELGVTRQGLEYQLSKEKPALVYVIAIQAIIRGLCDR